jgi:hypothetical protein
MEKITHNINDRVFVRTNSEKKYSPAIILDIRQIEGKTEYFYKVLEDLDKAHNFLQRWIIADYLYTDEKKILEVIQNLEDEQAELDARANDFLDF